MCRGGAPFSSRRRPPLLGIAIDAGSGDRELTFLFAAFYVIGCVAAVLAVRQSGIFTAVVQPPLILFIAVPTAYFLFHRAEIAGIKDVLINCGYPLIERFLLMFTTSVVVLLIGMARWYFGAADRAGKATPKDAGTAVGAGLVAGIGAKVAALLNRRTADDADEPTGAPSRSDGRASTPSTGRPPQPDRPGSAAPPSARRRAGPGTPGRPWTTPTDRRPPRAGATPPAHATSTTLPGLRRPVGGARRANRACKLDATRVPAA